MHFLKLCQIFLKYSFAHFHELFGKHGINGKVLQFYSYMKQWLLVHIPVGQNENETVLLVALGSWAKCCISVSHVTLSLHCFRERPYNCGAAVWLRSWWWMSLVVGCNVFRCYSSVTSDFSFNDFISLLQTGQINNDSINALCTYVPSFIPHNAILLRYIWPCVFVSVSHKPAFYDNTSPFLTRSHSLQIRLLSYSIDCCIHPWTTVEPLGPALGLCQGTGTADYAHRFTPGFGPLNPISHKWTLSSSAESSPTDDVVGPEVTWQLSTNHGLCSRSATNLLLATVELICLM